MKPLADALLISYTAMDGFRHTAELNALEDEHMKITHAAMTLIALAAGLTVAEPGKPVAVLDQVPQSET